SKRDWSSDVCSSDLHPYNPRCFESTTQERHILYEFLQRSGRVRCQRCAQACQPKRHERYRVMRTEEEEGCRGVSWALEEGYVARSEERRVGKGGGWG